MPNSIIELKVRNHPGVMSHITGLFARRAFNLEGILCGPIGDGSKSRIYLLVHEDNRLKQVMKHLEKLYDVLEVSLRQDLDHTLFNRLHEFSRHDGAEKTPGARHSFVENPSPAGC
ncbi:MAG: ACT domain-containing protein [Deltaproteobacteria bacterium]|nr:ACT domain-containing protein [Deltaproteobacteria bacterium]MBW2019603.1 ACT domain-containing protein [Deltaproteobacteria bacterium]MBW2074418.1 ACT domain-containing protein [Deltaproteobacteria bacterium]